MPTNLSYSSTEVSLQFLNRNRRIWLTWKCEIAAHTALGKSSSFICSCLTVLDPQNWQLHFVGSTRLPFLFPNIFEDNVEAFSQGQHYIFFPHKCSQHWGCKKTIRVVSRRCTKKKRQAVPQYCCSYIQLWPENITSFICIQHRGIPTWQHSQFSTAGCWAIIVSCCTCESSCILTKSLCND